MWVRSECMTETLDAISMIENLIEQHPNHSVIIGGDIKSELVGNSPYDAYWSELMTKFNLASCDPCFSPSTITYRHASFNHYFILSLLEHHLLTDHIILDGENLSDHLPILMTLSAQFEVDRSQQQKTYFSAQAKMGKAHDST